MRVRGEGGQALPLMLALVALVTVTTLFLGDLGARAVASARARTAADAAALAGAAVGPEAAEALARANGADRVGVAGGPGDVTVTAGVGGERAVARAEAPPPVGGATAGLTPAMQAAVARAGALLGTPVPVVSGWRSRAEQEALWAARHTNPYPVAPPGTSMHERGLAIDVPADFVPQLREVARPAGLCQPLPVSDPVHFELCRWTTVATRAT